MNYEQLTITDLNNIPVTGHASNVSVQAQGGHAFHPTFNRLFAVERDTSYIISITNLVIEFNDEINFGPVLTEIDIRVNNEIYRNCRQLGAAVTSASPVPGKMVFTGTLTYAGYLWLERKDLD